MKKNILLFLFALVSSNLLAQITVTNSTFPAAGDTLRFAVDAAPSINLQTAGENKTWNFTFLDGPTFESIIFDAQDGAAFTDFSNATSLTGQPPVAEIYFQSTTSAYSNLGYSGEDPVGLGLNLVAKNNPPLTEQFSPMNYGDNNSVISASRVAFDWDDLPATITDSLAGGFPIAPDSIAFEIETDRIEEVDAWGEVFIPGGNFEVLRVRRWDVSDRKILALFPIFGWSDVSTLINGLIPAGQGQLLGMDTTLTYRYYNDSSKEPIAVVTADPITEEPTNAQYKAGNGTTSVIKLHQKKANIYAYPNPAIDNIRFDIVNVPSGKYELKIFNILGIEVWGQSYQFQNTTDTVLLNVSDFKKGTYLYTLVNEKGKRIATRRLLILRP